MITYERKSATHRRRSQFVLQNRKITEQHNCYRFLIKCLEHCEVRTKNFNSSVNRNPVNANELFDENNEKSIIISCEKFRFKVYNLPTADQPQ